MKTIEAIRTVRKHKQTTLFYLLVASLVAVLVLSACVPGTEEKATTSYENQNNVPQVGNAISTITMNPTGTLTSGAASQVIGGAELTVLDDGNTKVVMTLSGLEPNSSHMGHIHVGDCSIVGPVALGLNPVEADANGKGSSTSTITTAKLPAEAYIAYHQRGPTDPAGVGSFISCGNL